MSKKTYSSLLTINFTIQGHGTYFSEWRYLAKILTPRYFSRGSILFGTKNFLISTHRFNRRLFSSNDSNPPNTLYIILVAKMLYITLREDANQGQIPVIGLCVGPDNKKIANFKFYPSKKKDNDAELLNVKFNFILKK